MCGFAFAVIGEIKNAEAAIIVRSLRLECLLVASDGIFLLVALLENITDRAVGKMQNMHELIRRVLEVQCEKYEKLVWFVRLLSADHPDWEGAPR